MTHAQACLCIIFSALLHAVWNALVRRQAARNAQVPVGPVVLAVALALSIVALAVCPAQAALSGRALLWAAAAGLGEATYFLTLGTALASMPLGQAYAAIRGGGLVLVWGSSTAFLAEPLSLLGSGGCALLLLGLLWPPSAGRWRPALPPPSVLVCALGTAIYHLAYGQGLRAGAPALGLFCVSLLVAVPVLLVALGARGMGAALTTLRAAPLPLGLAGALSALAFLLFLLSLRHLDAGAGFALRNTSIVFAQLLGWLGGEPVRLRQFGRAGAVFVGACAVAAA